MALNFTHVQDGVNLVPKITSTVNSNGDIDYDTTTNSFNFFGGGVASTIVGSNTTQTLTNKTISTALNTILSGSATNGEVLTANGSGGTAFLPASSTAGVSSLNTLTGAVVLAAGANITLTPSSNTITIASSGGTKVPTVTALVGISGTYTTPVSPSPLYLKIRMVGGGGGGGGGGNTSGAGGTGGTTAFGTSLLTATGGGGGVSGGPSGAGGTTSITSGPIILLSLSGSVGGSGSIVAGNGLSLSGISGANSPFGGAGNGSLSTGGAAVSHTGSGGGGSFASNTSGHATGSGGSSGGYIEAIISSPLSSYAYTNGASGAGGVGSDSSGGAGATGFILVEEYYS